jgi:hypothetical protein
MLGGREKEGGRLDKTECFERGTEPALVGFQDLGHFCGTAARQIGNLLYTLSAVVDLHEDPTREISP